MFQETQEQAHRRLTNFTYHPPGNEKIVKAHEMIRDTLRDASQILNDNVPAGRDLAIAQTQLEYVMYAANAGIARNHAAFGVNEDGSQDSESPAETPGN